MKQVKLVAILNITPNSFSDGGLYIEPSEALKQVQKLLQAKPDVIDIGAVSTRPKSVAPSIKEEKDRFDKILPAIAPDLKSSSVEISIDSYNFETLQYLMDKLPITWINDQSGFEDKRIIDLAKDTDIKLVIMHNVTLHADPKKTVPQELNITSVVKDWLLRKADYLMSYGIRKDQIIFDPGVGMGKTAEQSWQLIRDAKIFVDLGYPVYYGHSRKSFTNLVTDKPFAERDLETSVISSYLSSQGVDYLRVHDVEMNSRAISINKHLI
jgi:dihydropteroate synthase